MIFKMIPDIGIGQIKLICISLIENWQSIRPGYQMLIVGNGFSLSVMALTFGKLTSKCACLILAIKCSYKQNMKIVSLQLHMTSRHIKVWGTGNWWMEMVILRNPHLLIQRTCSLYKSFEHNHFAFTRVIAPHISKVL